MEEAEVPLEHLHEHVKESAEHTSEAWISWVALSTAILAVLAAIASLLSGEYANEAMMNQIETSSQWSYYQAKSIKSSVLDVKMGLSGVPDEQDQFKRARYEKEQEEIKSEAEHKQAAAKSYFHKHEVFARGVTMASSITQAREGKLYLMCGGNEDAFRKAEPILKELASQIRFVGKAGEAAKVKALVNMVMNINTAGLAEGLGLGSALGLDLTMLREIFSQTGANSRVLETDGEDMQRNKRQQ